MTKTVKIAVLLVVIFELSYAEPPFTWINQMHNITQDEHVSMLSGIIAWEMGIVERMYRANDVNNLKTHCIREMFYLQPDDVSFRPTIHENKPSTYYTSKTIGKLVSALAEYRTAPAQERDTQALKQKLQSIIVAEVYAVKELFVKKMKPVEQNVREIEQKLKRLEEEKKDLEKLHTGASKTIRTLQKKKGALTEQEHIKLTELVVKQNRIKEMAIEKQRLEQEKSDLKKMDEYKKVSRTIRLLDQTVIKNIARCVEQFVAAAEQEVNDVQIYTTEHCSLENVLTAWLWAHSNVSFDGVYEKQDLIDYCNAVDRFINNDALNRWIFAHPYTQNDYELFIKQLAQQKTEFLEKFITQHYELAVFSRIAHRTWKQFLPPIIVGIQTAYDHPTKGVVLAANCVETAFRNMCNILLYNRAKGLFDSAYCESIEKIHPYVRDFYNTNSHVETMRSRSLYNEWARFLTNVDGFTYIHPDNRPSDERFYEMQSSIPNIVKAINYIFLGNDPRVDMLSCNEQLDLFCKTVSRDDFKLSWRSDDAINTSNFATLYFLINGGQHGFVWHILHEHSFIPPQKEDTLYPRSQEIVQTVNHYLLKSCFS